MCAVLSTLQGGHSSLTLYAHRDDPDAAYVRIDAAPGDKPADPAAIAMSGASIRPIVGGISKREWRLDLPTRATAAIVSDKQV